MKEAYYFSHDSNARNDKKILDMLSVYGAEGYGWYWMLVEMMRDASDYKLDMQSKYSFNAFAMQLYADSTKVKDFIMDCINEFGLFESDGSFFWSNSLLRRMEKKKKVSESRANAANKRWNNANVSKSNADAMQTDAKESKGNKSKGNKNESKDIDDEDIDAQYARVVDFYQRNIGQLPPAQYQYVEDWLETFDANVLILAMQRALDQGVGKWSYINRTLDEWQKHGAKTLADCKAQIIEFDRQKEERHEKSQAGTSGVRSGRDQTQSIGKSEFAFLDSQNRTGG